MSTFEGVGNTRVRSVNPRFQARPLAATHPPPAPRRVFPAPPGPVSVNRRMSGRRSVSQIARSSRERPTRRVPSPVRPAVQAARSFSDPIIQRFGCASTRVTNAFRFFRRWASSFWLTWTGFSRVKHDTHVGAPRTAKLQMKSVLSRALRYRPMGLPSLGCRVSLHQAGVLPPHFRTTY